MELSRPMQRKFRPQDLSNTAWAFARIRLLVEPLFGAISSTATSTISDFAPQHLATTAWSFARLRVRNAPFVDVLSTQSMERIAEFEPQHLANFAWACALLEYANGQLMDAISSQARSKIFEFAHLNLANTAWAFATLEVSDQQLMSAIADAAAQKLSEMDAQGAAAMIDAGIRSKELERFLHGALDGFLEVLPTTPETWQSAHPTLLSKSVVADNVGLCGTSKLLHAWKIQTADAAFVQRAEEAADVSSDSAWAFLEWRSDEAPEGGSAVCMTGPSSEVPSEADSWWQEESVLRAFPLAVRRSVERAACAEFRLLSRLAAELEGSSTRDVNLEVWLFASKTPCLSCLAAMRQFQILFPRASLYFAGTRGK